MTFYTLIKTNRFISKTFLALSGTLLIFSWFISSPVHADHKPLWEFGMGAAWLKAPHYRGSKQSKSYALPVPFFAYNGRRFKVDREGIRGEIFESKRLKLNISVGGFVPVPEVDSGPRADMPALDTVLEVGPSLEYNLWPNLGKYQSLWLKLPLRAVHSVGNPLLDFQGWVFAPHIKYRNKIHSAEQVWQFTFSIGPAWATQRYHDYYYEVDAKFANQNRIEYHPHGGFSGNRVGITISRRSQQIYFGFAVRYDNLKNTAFEDSPLTETSNYLVVGMVLSWIFSESDYRVPDIELLAR
jgi:outer membrane protein